MKILTEPGLNLEDLLPHRGRMLLVRDILEVDGSHAVTRSVVDDSWPLLEDDAAPPLILVELAAQTAGVCNGLERIQSRGRDSDQMGWLVGIKKTDFFIDHLPIGSTVVVRAENSYNFGNLREVDCEMFMHSKLIGRATLQLFQAQ